jgi:glycosyltransferase involved in cell wall biosynthesis
MGNPLVDIIIPCYNMSAYLRDAVESALAQTYRPIRIVVVDDGSQEDIRSLLDSYGGKVEYVRQENRGQAAARNAGIRTTSGEFLCFLDADDIILPSKISDQVEYLEAHQEIDLVHGSWLLFDEEEICFPYAEWRPVVEWSDYFEPLTMMCPFPIHSITIRRRLIENCGYFPEELRGECEDWAFWFRCAAQGVHIYFQPKMVALYRQHVQSASSDARRFAQREANWMRLLVQACREKDLLKGLRRKLVSCGVRFVATRLLRCGMDNEYTSLMQAATDYGIIEDGMRCAAQMRRESIPMIYLLLARDLCDLSLPHLAAFALLHAGDLRLVRHEAEKNGFGHAFIDVISRMEALASDFSVCTKPQYIPPKREIVQGIDFMWLEQRIPNQVSHMGYVVHQLGLLETEKRDYDKAVMSFRRAISLNPYYRLFYEDLVRVLDQSGRNVEAEQVVGELQEIDSDYPYCSYYKGKVSLKHLHIAEGWKNLTHAWTLDRVSWLRYVLNDLDPLILRHLGPGVWKWRKKLGSAALSSKYS